MRVLLSALLSLLGFWGQDHEAALGMNFLPTMEELFAAPCEEMEVPEPLAKAIAMVESGLQPWVLNIEGASYNFDSKQEALNKAQEAWRLGQSFDVGPMQVNVWWLKRYGISLEQALDPLANVYLGVWILRKELDRHNGDTQAAVGAYHSPTPTKAGRYAATVMATLKSKEDAIERRGARMVPIDDAPEPVAAAKQPQPRVYARVTRKAEEPAATEPSGVVPAPLLVLSSRVAVAQAHSMKVSANEGLASMKVGLHGQD